MRFVLEVESESVGGGSEAPHGIRQFNWAYVFALLVAQPIWGFGFIFVIFCTIFL